MKKFICFLCILKIFTQFTAFSLELSEIEEKIIADSDINSLVTGEAYDIFGDIKIDNSTNLAKEAIGIFERGKVYINEIFAKSTETMVKILVIIVISSLGIGFSVGNDVKNIEIYINMATTLSVAYIILLDVRSILALCMQAIFDIDILSKGIMPVMVTAISMSGAPTTASLHYFATMFAFDLVISLIYRLMFPLIYVYIAIITVNSAISNDILIKLADFLKWGVVGSLKIIITLFITYLTISGAISGNADIFAVKTTKLLVSSTVPVVGSIISDASESILIGASVIKNSIGIFGIFAVVSVCFIPVLYILVNFFMFKVMSVVVSVISTKNITKLLEGISESYSMALAMICSCASILFIMMVISIVFVGGL